MPRLYRVLDGVIEIRFSISFIDHVVYGCMFCGSPATEYPHGIVRCSLCDEAYLVAAEINTFDVEGTIFAIGSWVIYPHPLENIIERRPLSYWLLFHESYQSHWGYLFNFRELINDRQLGSIQPPMHVRVFEPVAIRDQTLGLVSEGVALEDAQQERPKVWGDPQPELRVAWSTAFRINGSRRP